MASEVRRLHLGVEAYLAWAEALFEYGSVDARSCLAEARAFTQQSMERAALVAAREKTQEVERLLAAQAS